MEELLEMALPKGYVAAFRFLQNRDEAREACQEAATRAWSARAQYDGTKPFYPWFYRILRNLCFDRLKLRKRSELLVDEPASKAASADTHLVANERALAVHRAIAQLGVEMREVIELRHFQDLSYEEMATILGCAQGTVMSRLFRARKALSEKLKEDASFAFVSGKHGEIP